MRYPINILMGFAVTALLIFGSCSKDKKTEPELSCGIASGVVNIDISPLGSTDFSVGITVRMMGESNTQASLDRSDFHYISAGNYRASFSLGSYDCSPDAMFDYQQGITPGIYSIRFYGSVIVGDSLYHFTDRIISTIGDSASPIEIEAEQTTNVGAVDLTLDL